MKNVMGIIALFVAAAFLNTAECAITGYSTPVIGTATGNAALTNKINAGATSATVTGVSIIATSDDGGGVTTYTIASQTPASPALSITNAGVVSVSSGTVVYESGTTTAFVLLVAPNDAGGVASTGTVTLSINAMPVITSHDSSSCIVDGSGENVDLIDLAATDSNTGTTITWAIASGNTNTDFSISAAGLIQVAAGQTLAASTTASYTLVITAADDSSTPLTATTTVTASVQTTCSSAGILAMSLMTILSALISTKL